MDEKFRPAASATEISTEKQFALVGEPKRKIYRKTGGNTMVRVMAANQVSINNPKTGKTSSAPFTAWLRTLRPQLCSSKHPRQGRVIDTDKGRVRITSRPGKDGVINGVLLE